MSVTNNSRIARALRLIKHSPKGVYIASRPIELCIAIFSIIASAVFIVNPSLASDLSISFLPGSLEYAWFLAWFISGSILSIGLFAVRRFVQSAGFLFLSTVIFSYCIGLAYQASIESLFIIAIIPAVGLGSLLRFIYLLRRGGGEY